VAEIVRCTWSPIGARDTRVVAALGFYLQPPAWVISKPPLTEPPPFGELREEVYSTQLKCGITAVVSRDGLFMFDFQAWRLGQPIDSSSRADNEARRNRFAAMNAFLAGLFTEFFRGTGQRSELMTIDVPPVTSERLHGSGFGVRSTPVAHLMQILDPGSYERGKPFTEDRRLLRSRVLSRACVEAAFERFDHLADSDDASHVDIADLMLRACSAHANYSPHGSLMQSWPVAERVLNMLWEEQRRSLPPRPSRDPRFGAIRSDLRGTLDDPNPPVAAIGEALHVLGIVDAELHKQLGGPRRARNAWVHGLQRVDFEQAAQSLTTAERLLRDHLGLDLDLVPGLLIVPA
jgi:hypothetical protein